MAKSGDLIPLEFSVSGKNRVRVDNEITLTELKLGAHLRLKYTVADPATVAQELSAAFQEFLMAWKAKEINA